MKINVYIKCNAKRRAKMAQQGFVWVKDKAGNEFVCAVSDLKDPKNVSEEDLENCMDDATMGVNIGD
jgi:hypothetical protein